MWVYTAIASAVFFGMAIALARIRDRHARKESELTFTAEERESADHQRLDA
jgi:hypothetical protein